MRVLGIESSSPTGSVALLDSGHVVASREHSRPNAHAEALGELVADVTTAAGWRPTDIELVAVGKGPGSFTGLRVGIALAQGIASGLSVPVVGTPSLAVMAAAVPADVAGVRVVAVDARRGEVFLAAYAADGAEVLAVRAVAPDQLSATVSHLGEPVVVCGDLADALVPLPRYRSEHSDRPHAIFAARIGEQLAATGDLPTDVLPLYVRDADATLPNLPDSPLGKPRQG